MYQERQKAVEAQLALTQAELQRHSDAKVLLMNKMSQLDRPTCSMPAAAAVVNYQLGQVDALQSLHLYHTAHDGNLTT